MSSPLLLGVLAGLAVALPVGPVGILLLRTGLEVFIEVRLAEATTNEEFTAALTRGFGQVLDAVHVTGSYDYLLHAVVADPAALDLFVRRLKREAGAGQTFTRLALRA